MIVNLLIEYTKPEACDAKLIWQPLRFRVSIFDRI